VTVSSTQGGSVSVQTTIKGVVPQAFAAAGGNQSVAKGSIVTLDGSGSIGMGLTYSWSVDALSTNIATDPLWAPTSPTTGFTFPSTDDLITITLTVTDSLGVTSSDTIFVTNTVMAAAGLDQTFLPPPNGPGFPDAGVLLDASSSQGVGLSFSWVQIPVDTTASPQCVNDALDGAVSIAIDPTNAALTTVSMPLTGGCVTLELTASGPGGFATDTVTIKAPVGAPAANAGVDIVTFASQIVQLDASASTGLINSPTSTPPGFVWTQLAGGTDTVAIGKTVAGGIEYISATTGVPFTIDPNVDAIPAAADVTAPNISMPVFVFPATFQTLTFQVDVTGPGGSASSTVNVIMDNPATADILTPTRARYVENKGRFTVSGTTDHIGANGHSVTCWLAAPGAPLTDANLIGTGSVIPNTPDWKVDVFNGLNPCLADPGVDPTDCKGTPIGSHVLQVQCISSLGGTLDTPLDWEAK